MSFTPIEETIKRFEEIGIIGLDPTDFASDQRLVCPQPQCQQRKKNTEQKLYVNISKQIFHCFHCGWKGTVHDDDLPDLSDAMLSYKMTPVVEDEELTNWFHQRGINHDALVALNIKKAVSKWADEYKPTIVFPNYFHRKLISAKLRLNAEYSKHGTKDFRQQPNGYPMFYNISAVNNSNETMIIVEGEMDVLSLYECGITNAISVPSGAPSVKAVNFHAHFKFIDNSIMYLNKIKNFIIAVDNDEPGLKLKEQLATRLGKDRCSFVTYPPECKDLNDVLIKHGREKVQEIVSTASPYPTDGIVSASDIWTQVLEVYENGYPDAEKLYIGDFDAHLKIRTGRLYAWTGIPNHGKTVFVDNFFTKLFLRGWKALIYSPETERAEHIARQSEQLTGKPFHIDPKNPHIKRISKEELDDCRRFLDKHCYYLLADEDNADWDTIFTAAKTYAQRFGVNLLMIDPFNTVAYDIKDFNNNSNEYIGNTLDKLKFFAKKYNVSVHVIAHPTKMLKDKDGNFEVPTPYNISDSQHWFNKPDVCGTIYRRRTVADLSNPIFETEVYIQKVKHRTLGKMQTMFKLNFDKHSERFYGGSPDYRNYLEELKKGQIC